MRVDQISQKVTGQQKNFHNKVAKATKIRKAISLFVAFAVLL